MLDFILDLLFWIFRRGRNPEQSKLFPRENVGPITEEEILRDRLEEQTRCLNQLPK